MLLLLLHSAELTLIYPVSAAVNTARHEGTELVTRTATAPL